MRMTNILGHLIIILLLAGCGDDPTPKEVERTVQVTILNASGRPEMNVGVYVFAVPATEPGGQDPAAALTSSTTNKNGEVNFSLRGLPGIEAGASIYLTALEEVMQGEFNVLGSIGVVIGDEETVAKELVIAERTQYGFFPATISNELAMSEYNRWKTTQVVSCNDGLRVKADPPSETRVEGIGFGMLLAAYANDQPTFDGLHAFYNSKRTTQANNMMAWLVTCDGIADPGSATDGDIDVAFALIVASKQWGGTYLNAAREIIERISSSLIVSCTIDGTDSYILAPGYSGGRWGGCQMTDLMYHTPAFFRVFAAVSGDNTWSQLADDTYRLLEAGAHPTTGLVPDWQTASGTPGPGGRVGHFGYDACRAPWRLSLDYLWNGNLQAQEWCSQISGWAVEVGPENIVDGYELDGTPIGTNGRNSSFVGGFAVAAMCHSKGRVNVFGSTLSALNDTYWFNLNTRCLYLFTLTGNFWDPLRE